MKKGYEVTSDLVRALKKTQMSAAEGRKMISGVPIMRRGYQRVQQLVDRQRLCQKTQQVLYPMKCLGRQLPFLRSMLQQANRTKRQDLLQHANANQINAVSELVLNLLKNKIPVTPPILAKLRPYKKVLRDLGRRRHSVKKRRAWLVQQKGRGLFQWLHHVLCQCVR